MAARLLDRAVADDRHLVPQVRGQPRARRPEASETGLLLSSGALACLMQLCSACSHSSHTGPVITSCPRRPFQASTLVLVLVPHHPPCHAHHAAPPHVHHRARTARHSKPSLSTSLRQASTVPSLHEPSLSPQPSLTAQMASAEVCSCTESRRFELSPPSPAREAHLSWQPHMPVRGCQQHHQRLSDSPCGDDAHAS